MNNRVHFFLNDGLIHWGHRGQQMKDSSYASQWNTSQNNDNSDDREQAVYWLNTKATKWSISSCCHCLIVPICWFQRTEECVCVCVRAVFSKPYSVYLAYCWFSPLHMSASTYKHYICILKHAFFAMQKADSERITCFIQVLGCDSGNGMMKLTWLLCNVSHAHFKQPGNNVGFMCAYQHQMQIRSQTNTGLCCFVLGEHITQYCFMQLIFWTVKWVLAAIFVHFLKVSIISLSKD